MALELHISKTGTELLINRDNIYGKVFISDEAKIRTTKGQTELEITIEGLDKANNTLLAILWTSIPGKYTHERYTLNEITSYSGRTEQLSADKYQSLL